MIVRVFAQQLVQHFVLDRILGCHAVLLAWLRHGVIKPQVGGHGNADFHYVGGSDPALLLQVFPGDIVLLGADERENVLFPTIFTHQSSGKPQTATGLDFSGNAKDGCRQKVNLIVYDQSPIAFVEEIKMRKFLEHGQSTVLRSPLAIGHRLIGGDSHRADLFAMAGIFANLILEQCGFIQQFIDPLAHGNGIGSEDQCVALHLFHRRHTNHRLARPTGQNNDA